MRLSSSYTIIIPRRRQALKVFKRTLNDAIYRVDRSNKKCFSLVLKSFSDFDPNHPSQKVDNLPIKYQNYEVYGLRDGSVFGDLSFLRVQNGKHVLEKSSYLMFDERGGVPADPEWDNYSIYRK